MINRNANIKNKIDGISASMKKSKTPTTNKPPAANQLKPKNENQPIAAPIPPALAIPNCTLLVLLFQAVVKPSLKTALVIPSAKHLFTSEVHSETTFAELIKLVVSVWAISIPDLEIK